MTVFLLQPPLPPPLQKMSQFTDETLFYIFYAMPRDLLQQAAAAELYAREWRYHRELKLWFTRMPGTEPTQKTPTYERGTYIYFDVHSWQKVCVARVAFAGMLCFRLLML
jgi:CCR4-NOT transcription complex subunit 2